MNRITDEQREAIVREAIAKRDALLAEKPDCAGGSPCTTCPDKRQCGKTGCMRKPEFIGGPVRATPKFWLWKNFVDGKPEYWAFDNPYPINLEDGDPQTLGEPCGYAIFKPSRDGSRGRTEEQVLRAIDRTALASAPAGAGEGAPIDMLLYCPNCGTQHVDREEWQDDPHDIEQGQMRTWSNPPHRSHLCHGCGTIWRPADVPTNGVAELKTHGKADNWPAPHNEEVRAALAGEPAVAADEGRIKTVRELRDIQGRDGTWNCDYYMHGLYNGLELAVATLESRDPQYRSAPKRWLMVTQAERDVCFERKRQIQREGWTPEHDSQHASGEIAAAAACYAINAAAIAGTPPPRLNTTRDLWPWHESWFKCTTPRRDLVKAGALILAEIERLDRAASQDEQQEKQP